MHLFLARLWHAFRWRIKLQTRRSTQQRNGRRPDHQPTIIRRFRRSWPHLPGGESSFMACTTRSSTHPCVGPLFWNVLPPLLPKMAHDEASRRRVHQLSRPTPSSCSRRPPPPRRIPRDQSSSPFRRRDRSRIECHDQIRCMESSIHPKHVQASQHRRLDYDFPAIYRN